MHSTRLTFATPELGADVHFTALYVARERGLLALDTSPVAWAEYPGGSGDVARALADGRAGIGVALTDSLILARIHGAALRLVGTFVTSPLRWLVLVPVASPARGAGDLRGATFGITRAGGGAHTTLRSYAHTMGWQEGHDYTVTPLGSLDALVRALGDGSIDAFLWESLTVKRLLDAGTARAVGTVVPPWPSFSVAASEEAIARHPDAVHGVLRALLQAGAIVASDPDATAALTARQYALSLRDARDWLAHVAYSEDGALSRGAIEAAVSALHQAGAITGVVSVPEIIAPGFAPLTT